MLINVSSTYNTYKGAKASHYPDVMLAGAALQYFFWLLVHSFTESNANKHRVLIFILNNRGEPPQDVLSITCLNTDIWGFT